MKILDTVTLILLNAIFCLFCWFVIVFLNDLLDFIRSQARICVRLFMYLHRKCRQCSV